MAASRAQQVGIWVIAITLTVGTIGSFAAIVLQNENQASDQLRQQEEYEQQLADFEEQQREAAQANAENSIALEGYEAQPFSEDISELQVEVLEAGSGETVQTSDTISASYFGWLSDGTIFDSSNKKDAENEPVSFPLSGVIAGWTQGLSGQKVGSTVRLTIPAELAYGPQSSGIIPENAPLQFIVIIDSIEEEPAA